MLHCTNHKPQRMHSVFNIEYSWQKKAPKKAMLVSWPRPQPQQLTFNLVFACQTHTRPSRLVPTHAPGKHFLEKERDPTFCFLIELPDIRMRYWEQNEAPGVILKQRLFTFQLLYASDSSRLILRVHLCKKKRGQR